MIEILTTPAPSPVAHLILAHGAGAGMSSGFMEAMAHALAEAGVTTTRFEFGYMAARRTGGSRRPPPTSPALMEEYRAAVIQIGQTADTPLLIGGKSMGGRIASMVADELHLAGLIQGLVCLGYPFHPTGKPETLRVAHLAEMTCPALIVQGDRDPLGTRQDVEGYALSPSIGVMWLADGDHDFKPRKASGHSQASHIWDAAAAISAFVRVS